MLRLLAILLLFLMTVRALATPHMPPWFDAHREFCRQEPADCVRYPQPNAKIAATQEVVFVIDGVNQWVNRWVTYTPDPSNHGVPDRWAYPRDRKGDCEDYALLKAKLLASLGFPRSSLLMAVVSIPNQKELHAVLLVRTTAGDRVLDNATPNVMAPAETGYVFEWVQSSRNPKKWVRYER